ncbi:MAG TPA: glycosyltransferase [Steroidobacter sp.]|uniref:glycosyltransferase n=1 Tax=Steroidobacter sp. TaxID=1978227 RepID=UPI002ED9CC87
MSEANLRQIRVLHIVSAGGVASSLQPSLFMPLLTRLPRQRVKAQVACLSPGAVPSAVLRQNGVPTFDLALSRKRFSPKAFGELLQSARHFRPDVIQAWGHTAQVISAMLRKRCEWKPQLVWSVSDTVPMAKNAGFIDRQKLKYAAKFASGADRIVYTSEAAASQHRRVGFPDGGHETVPPGVDATRFKPDFAARRKLREELSLPGETFVVGMAAPFQPEFDHATLLKAVGELIKVNPHVAVVLAGHGVQKGNAPLMALVGGGSLATRVHLLGEWSDINGLYNACDVVCSSAVNDQARMNVVMAMLCGVPCVATGIGAQGEVIGQHGVAIEPGNPAAFVKGITRVMQLSPEKRTHMAQGARKHALANYVYVRSLQKYLQLYYDLIGRQSLVTKDLPTPEIDAALTVPPALPTEAEMNAVKRKPITVVDLSDPDSLESKVAEREPEELPKWRIEQEEERKKREDELAAKVAASKSVGDVLQVFESEQKAAASETPMTERARGVADDSEELLSPDLLAAEAPTPPRVSNGPSGSKKPSAPAPAPVASKEDAAKQAALKAARMAALQPIASRPVAAPKASAAVTRPPVTKAASPVTRPPASANTPPVSTPITRPPASTPLTRPAATAAPEPAKAASITTAAAPESAKPAASAPPEAAKAAVVASAGPASTPRSEASLDELLDMLPESAWLQPASPNVSTAAVSQPAAPNVSTAAVVESAKADLGGTQPMEMLSGVPLLPEVESNVSAASGAGSEKVDLGSTQPLELLPEIAMLLGSNVSTASAAESTKAEAKVDLSGEQLPDLLPEISLFSSAEQNVPAAPAAIAQTAASAEPAVSAEPAKVDLGSPRSAEPNVPSAPVAETEASASVGDSSEKFDPNSTQSMGKFAQALANATMRLAAFKLEAPVDATPPETARAEAGNDAAAASSGGDFGELALMATGQWMAMRRPETKPEAKAAASKSGELSGAETLSLISTPASAAKAETSSDPAIQLALLPDPGVEPKRAASGK